MHDSTTILVDAYSQIYRGFYAIQGLKNSKGEPSNAVFAVARLLLSLENSYPTCDGAFAFDLGKSAKRVEILPQYKANRPPMPEDLRKQMPYIKELIAAFGWQLLEKEGWEADDIIAASIKEFPTRKFLIVSSDKDLVQLVNEEHVNMLVPDRKGGGFEIWKPEQVKAKFDVPPEKIVLYLAMVGDSSDNIPGIEGIGPKTAAKLLQEFSSFDEILKNAEKIPSEKLKTKILASADLISKNIELIRLEGKMPDNNWQTPQIFRRNPLNWDMIESIAKNFDMTSILKEIAKLRKNTTEQELPFEKKDSAYSQKKEQFETPDLFDFKP